MSESVITPLPTIDAWGCDLEAAVCENCHWRYLVPRGSRPPACPNCYRRTLSILPGGLPDMPHPYPPELVLPFQAGGKRIQESVRSFRAGIPFPPAGLNEAELASRMSRLYLPGWLVDADISAAWQGEAGFDYEVVSHQEIYDQNRSGWDTREVKEPRVRWDSRAGTLRRAYQNVAAPALDGTAQLEKQLGTFDQASAEPYRPGKIERALIRLPDHSPQDSWVEALAVLRMNAARECQQACAANHIRQFQWKPEFTGVNWTLMLQPVYSTFYLDDRNRPQPILIHGQTGKASGVRRASLKRAGTTSLWVLAFSLVILLSGLLLDFWLAESQPGLRPVSTYIAVLGVLGLAGSAVPYIIAWDFNRRQAIAEAPGADR